MFIVIKISAPGPGTYRNPSDFGNYDHLNFYIFSDPKIQETQKYD